MVDVIIRGFKSDLEAEEFITWYCEQGEQDAAEWFETIADGKNVRDFLETDCKKTFPVKKEGDHYNLYIAEDK